MKKTLAGALLAAGLLACGQAHASTYVQAYAGGVYPHDSDARGGASEGEAEFNQGFAAGAKVGGWWEALPYLGLQLDFNASLNSFDALSSGGARADLSADLNIYSATLNAIFRLPEGFIRPYAGIGGGYFYADIDRGSISAPLLGLAAGFPGDNDDAFGWNALGGVEFVLMADRLSALVEYRYTRADFEFNAIGLDLDYASSQVHGAMAYSF